MAVKLEWSAHLSDILNGRDVPIAVVGKLQELQVVEASGVVGLSAHAQDLWGVSQASEIRRGYPRIWHTHKNVCAATAARTPRGFTSG